MFTSLFHSFLIAQVFGLYLVMISIVMIGRASYYRERIAKISIDNVSILSIASIWLLIGILLILVHNVWIFEPRLLVTILGWVIVIKSTLWLAAPSSTMKLAKAVCRGPWYYVVGAITAIFGVLLMSKGFYFFI